MKKIKPSTLLVAITLCLISSQVCAEYRPPVSMGESKETWIIKADASVVQTDESFIRIESQKGVDNHGQRSVSYNSKLEKVEVIDAYTLQPDGTKIKVPRDAIRTTGDSVSDGAPMFSETKYKVVVYPNVKVGSQLFLKIKSIQHTPEFKGHFFYSQFFSPHYKYSKQEINIIVSDKLPLQIESKGMEGGLIKSHNLQKHYQYTFSQDSAAAVETYQVDSEDFSPYLIASTFKDQIDLGKAYEKGVASKIKVTPAIQKLADELTTGKTGQKEQVEALYNWVSKNIRYVAIYLGHGGVVPHDAETILKNQYGDCKDHTVILAALLKAKGIESSSALINLGDSYTLPKLAVLDPLNHVINYIPSLNIYLDSTAQFAPYGTLPFEDMDKPVILTSLSKMGRTPAAGPNENMIKTSVEIKIDKDGTIYGKSRTTLTGYFNEIYRARESNDQGADDNDRVSRRLRSFGETGSGKITATDPTDLSIPFVENASFQIDPKSNFPGPGAITIPVGVVLTNLTSLGKDKPTNTYRFPQICYSRTLVENYTIAFPKGTKITNIPSNVNFMVGSINYRAIYKKEDDKIYAFRALKMNHENGICKEGFNDERKMFFNLLQRDLRAQIFYD